MTQAQSCAEGLSGASFSKPAPLRTLDVYAPIDIRMGPGSLVDYAEDLRPPGIPVDNE